MTTTTRAPRPQNARAADCGSGAGADFGPAFDEALDRLADLARLLGQVRAVHRPYRRLRWAGCHCAGCGQPHPCPTLRAADLHPTAPAPR